VSGSNSCRGHSSLATSAPPFYQQNGVLHLDAQAPLTLRHSGRPFELGRQAACGRPRADATGRPQAAWLKRNRNRNRNGVPWRQLERAAWPQRERCGFTELQIHEGERTDIHVDAVRPNEQNGFYDCVTVVIEVKGCWHREIDTAMETQLVKRYLANNECQHGLYLIGWFLCSSWTKNDRRRGTLRFKSIRNLESHLAQQAKDLSNPNRQVRVFVLDATLRRSHSQAKEPKAANKSTGPQRVRRRDLGGARVSRSLRSGARTIKASGLRRP